MDLTVEREEMDFKVLVTVRSLKTIEKGSVCGGEQETNKQPPTWADKEKAWKLKQEEMLENEQGK